MGLKLHPRERIVREAEIALLKSILDWRKEHLEVLSTGEELKIMNKTLSDTIAGIAKYMIREERHPGEPDRPGGLE